MWIYIAPHIKKGSSLQKKIIQVGAPGDNDRGDFSGAAYVFLRKADSFMEQVGGPPEKVLNQGFGFLDLAILIQMSCWYLVYME